MLTNNGVKRSEQTENNNKNKLSLRERINYGEFNTFEIKLFSFYKLIMSDRHIEYVLSNIEYDVSQYTKGAINALKDQAQAGWDPVGIYALANSVEKAGIDANRIATNLESKVDDVTRVTDRFSTILSGAVNNLLPHIDSATRSVEKVSNVGLNVNFKFDEILKIFDNPISAISCAAVLYLFLEIVERQYEVPAMQYIKVLIGAFMLYKVGTQVLPLLSSWFTPIVTVAQAEWDEWLSIAVQGVIFCVFGTTLDTSSMVKTVKSLGDAANNALKLQELFTVIVEWLKNVAVVVCTTFGVETADWLKPQDNKIKEFMVQVNELLNEYSRNPMAVGLEFSDSVTRLLMEINNYMVTVPINSKNQPVVNAVRDLQSKMAVLQRNVADAGMTLGERNEPGAIFTSGAPGGGKTYYADFLSQAIIMSQATNELEVLDAQRNWKQQVYVWPTENKHHDQYKGETVVMYPDLFCLTDAEGQPSEATAIVYLVGGQPVLLPAAELSKKQRLFFISKVILACTNVTFIHQKMFKSLRNADAVKRRLNRFMYYMWVNPRYALRKSDGTIIVDESTNKIKGFENSEIYSQIDPNLVPDVEEGIFPEDLWFFRQLDVTTGTFCSNKIYKYRSHMKLAIAHVNDAMTKGERKRNQLVESAEFFANERLNELRNVAQVGDIEYDEAEDVPIIPVNIPYQTFAELEIQNFERTKRKDQLDILRLQQLEGKIRREPVVIPDEEYHTTDEEEVEAQMDDGVVVNGLRYINIAAMNGEDMLDVDLNNVDILHLQNSVGKRSADIMYKTTDLTRLTWRDFFKSGMFDYITREEHERLNQIFEDANNMLEFNPPAENIRGLAFVIATQVEHLTPARGIVYQYIRAAIRQVDLELGTKLKVLSARHIIQLANLSYDEAKAKYSEFKYISNIKDPFLRKVLQATMFVDDMYHRYIQPVNNMALDALIGLWYDPIFQLGFQVFVGYTSGFLITCLTLPLMECWFSYCKRKTNRNHEVKLRTVNQASWTDIEAIKQTIDKHMFNFCGLYVVIHSASGTATRHPCNMVFLGGKIAVIVDHAREAIIRIQEKVRKQEGSYLELVIVPFVSTTMEQSTERFMYDDITFDTSEELADKDLAIIKFKHCMNRPHIHHLIPPVSCMEYMMEKQNMEGIFIERTTDLDLRFNGPEQRIDVRYNFGRSISSYDTDVSVMGENIKLKTYSYQTLVMKGKNSIFTTHSGYCTSPGFMTDERKNYCVNLGWKQAQQPWLCYLHTSLRSSNPNGVPIYSEMFETWIEELKNSNIKVRPPVEVMNENMEEFSKIIEEELELVSQGGRFEIVNEFQALDKNHISMASMDQKIFIPCKSEIKRSPLYGIEPRTRFPSRMGTVRFPDGTIVDTLKKAREPYGINNVLLNSSLIEEIIHQAMARVMSDSSLPIKKERLTLDQCLYGDGAYKLNSVNWNSSAGFYFRMLKMKYGTDWKGKRWMLNVDGTVKQREYKVILRMYDYLDKKLQDGERIYGTNIDNIKDELLKIEKVKKADSRLFCTNDFLHLLLCKSYMGAFAGWIFENRINNGIAIGVNPLSDEWEGIVSHLVNNSIDAIFLDHSKYDKDQIRQIMECVIILMNMFYGDIGSVNSKVRSILFQDIINSIHVTMYEGKLYFYCWDQGNTSGNFLTAILNSLVNICYLYICAIFAWMVYHGINPMMVKSLPSNPADKALSYITLGDDVVMTVRRDIMPGVNFNTIKDIGKKFLNIKITDELKTEGIIPDFRKINEGSFLGRKFVSTKVRGKLTFLAQLRWHSVVEKVQWIKGVYDPAIEVDKIENMNLELSMYTKDEFNAVVPKYAEACYKSYGVYPKYTDYEVAQRHVLTLSEYKYSFYDFLENEDMHGCSLTRILAKVAERETKLRYESGLNADIEACDASDYDVKITHHKTIEDGESPFTDIDVVSKL